MVLNRHQQFRLDAEKKWNEKWFKFITSQDCCDWYDISSNNNINMEFIEAHQYPWDWRGVSGNPNLTRIY